MTTVVDGRQPSLRDRILAAGGASVASVLLVNPLDVVKTRIQAGSMVADRPLPSCTLTRAPARYAVRWARPPSLADCQSKLPASPAASCGGTAHPAGVGPAMQRPLLGQLPMSSCACALKVADLGPSWTPAERCVNSAPFRPASATGVLRDIVRKEGLTALWRGADTAMLAAIPMVGVYMPLYDALLQRAAPHDLGAYAPALAGSAARTLAVLLVGPLELVRTRQQGSAAGARTAWGAVRDTLRDTAGSAAAGAAGGGGGAQVGVASAGSGAAATAGASVAGLLRTVPRLWTGVVATLARDVPFSALYWALVEPIRGGLLAQWGHDRQPMPQQPASQQQPQQQAAQSAPSGRAVLAANLVAGSAAGAAAAVVTTPFDVIKTRLQVGDVSARASSVAVARQVLAAEGLAGLFRGWGPRAARTAPACAVVVASYEVLKLLL